MAIEGMDIIAPGSIGEGPVSKTRQEILELYDVKYDTLNQGTIFIKSKETGDPVSFDELYLTMVDNGLKVSETLLRKILRCPAYFESVNPVSEYLNKLKNRYAGKSHIDILCNYIQARDFEDKKKKGHYQDRMNKIIRKWMVASVACSLGKHPNDVALGFIHATGGVGKTWLCEFFVPACLKGYYTIIKQAHDIDYAELFTQKFIINHDEMLGIDKKRPDEFKQRMSARDFEVYVHRDPFPKTAPRIANVLFTTNYNQESGGFITPQLGTRRFGAIELSVINKGYSEVVDVDQMWAEAVMLIDQDFDFVWSESDWSDFEEYNRRFLIEDTATKIITANFEMPEPDQLQDDFFRTATDIYNEITRKKLAPSTELWGLSPQKIGFTLQQLGYRRKSKRVSGHTSPVYVYHIKHITV